MGMVKIGGRELSVREPHESGSFLVEKDLVLAGKLVKEAPPEELHERLAGVILCYVRHNEGVTLQWLLENLPAETAPVMRACIVASGRKVKEPSQGEAARP